jgi:hypothetical protein
MVAKLVHVFKGFLELYAHVSIHHLEPNVAERQGHHVKHLFAGTAEGREMVKPTRGDRAGKSARAEVDVRSDIVFVDCVADLAWEVEEAVAGADGGRVGVDDLQVLR